jgi:LuxR family transcriptional regulator, maltose regulon positive regulatory protein
LTTGSRAHIETTDFVRRHEAAAPGATEPVLAATKLHIPLLRPRAVRRAGLVAALSAAPKPKLTLLSAPPGSGKTSLLSEWHADPAEPRPFVWISLDGGDNDPVRFSDGLIAALQTAREGLGKGARGALHSPGTTLSDHVMPLLINDLAALDEPLVIVLDDYHVIGNEQVHGPLEGLIERLPDTAQLVIATRSDPPFALSRLRASGHLVEIRGDDLRFTRAEAAMFLNDVLDLGLGDDEIARLHSRTEGWAAGLQLAGLSVRGREHPQEFIEAFAGDDQQIVDYLASEVLDRQVDDVRKFLLRSSILDRLSGPLCRAVTGADDAAVLLRQLDRENVFIVPLDSRREWYRYHHLFSDLLRHELARNEPRLVPELHRRASAWYREQGAVHEAIEHALAAGDNADAIELVTSHWYEFLQRGRHETVATWIDRLPPETVISDANLCLIEAWLGVNTGRLAEVDGWIEAAELAGGGQAAEKGIRAGIASLRAIHRYMNGNVGAAVSAGRYALSLEAGGPPSPWRPVGCPVLGLSLHWHGESDHAALTLEEGLQIAKSGGNHLAAMHASGGLAAIHQERGDLISADVYAAEAARIADEHDLGEHWASSLALAVRGQLLECRGELDAADRLVARAVRLAQRGVASVEIAYSLLTLAAVRQQLGRRADAAKLHQQAKLTVGSCDDPGVLQARLMRTERRLREASPGPSSHDLTGGEDLSAAELNVLRLLASDLSQREIASELQLSFNTIKTHTRNIYRKLGAATRAEALARARRLSLV